MNWLKKPFKLLPEHSWLKNKAFSHHKEKQFLFTFSFLIEEFLYVFWAHNLSDNRKDQWFLNLMSLLTMKFYLQNFPFAYSRFHLNLLSWRNTISIYWKVFGHWEWTNNVLAGNRMKDVLNCFLSRSSGPCWTSSKPMLCCEDTFESSFRTTSIHSECRIHFLNFNCWKHRQWSDHIMPFIHI